MERFFRMGSVCVRHLDFVMKPLEEALEIVKDSKYRTTIHSDQGWHYQHNKWVKTLKGTQGVPKHVSKRKLFR